VIDLELSKPGTAEFDIGQMAAEMYCLATFRNHANDQSFAMLEAFLAAYKAMRKVAVDAAKVAVRLGSHWLVIMPTAWAAEATPDQTRTATIEGRDFVRMGWERDSDAEEDGAGAVMLSTDEAAILTMRRIYKSRNRFWQRQPSSMTQGDRLLAKEIDVRQDVQALLLVDM